MPISFSRKAIAVAALFLVAAALLAGVGMESLNGIRGEQNRSPVILKFSHVVAPDTPKGMAAQFFARRAAELTRGRVRVEVYPDSSLYSDKDEMEALQLGAVQMLAPSLAKFGQLGVKEFEVFDLPYIFDDYAALHKVTQGSIGRELLRKLDGRGIVGLTYWDNGFKSFSANRAIRVPEDLRGLKMRVQPGSSVLEEEMRALGALPQSINFGETYQALQAGVVDGAENPISNFYTQKMYAVQKHLVLTEHGYLGYAVIVNKRFWDGLPVDVRDQLREALAEATNYANKIAREQNDRDLEAVRKNGLASVHVPTAEERSAFKRALLPVHQKMADRIGRDIIREVYRETGFRPSAP